VCLEAGPDTPDKTGKDQTIPDKKRQAQRKSDKPDSEKTIPDTPRQSETFVVTIVKASEATERMYSNI
jgi:hypothetical protein